MDFLNEYAPYIGELLTWLSNPDTTVPVVRLLQALAAIIGALISALGFYKAWKYAESKLGERLTDFLKKEEDKLAAARKSVAAIRENRSALKQDAPVIFSNRELSAALKEVRKRRFTTAEKLLTDALGRTQERESLAQEKAALHGKQRAMAHLLLGAIADSQNRNDEALAQFQAALQLDEHDSEALEYSALQLLKLGNPSQAFTEFERLAQIAANSGNPLLQARALRGCGRAHESMPTPSNANANVAYRDAIAAFPNNGPPLDIAYIHELRGLANMKIRNNKNQAFKSLMEALTRYSKLEHGWLHRCEDCDCGC